MTFAMSVGSAGGSGETAVGCNKDVHSLLKWLNMLLFSQLDLSSH